MVTLFENNDFRLELTGHDYDFVGTIETKTGKPLTFFFNEELIPYDPDDENCGEWVPDEDKTELLDVYEGLKPYDYNTDEGEDEAEDIASRFLNCDHVSWFTTRDDNSTGFLSDCRERGQFLALVKNYCPEQLKNIPWA